MCKKINGDNEVVIGDLRYRLAKPEDREAIHEAFFTYMMQGNIFYCLNCTFLYLLLSIVSFSIDSLVNFCQSKKVKMNIIDKTLHALDLI